MGGLQLGGGGGAGREGGAAPDGRPCVAAIATLPPPAPGPLPRPGRPVVLELSQFTPQVGQVTSEHNVHGMWLPSTSARGNQDHTPGLDRQAPQGCALIAARLVSQSIATSAQGPRGAHLRPLLGAGRCCDRERPAWHQVGRQECARAWGGSCLGRQAHQALQKTALAAKM